MVVRINCDHSKSKTTVVSLMEKDGKVYPIKRCEDCNSCYRGEVLKWK